VGGWCRCGERLIVIWVATWGRGFHCGTSDFCFSFKNTARATVPWQTTSFCSASSSRHEVMVGGALTRASAFRVGLGVGGAAVASGSRPRPSHSCDGWVCDLGAVDASLIFGLVRGTGAFAAVLPTFVLVSRMQFAQRYRGNAISFSATSSSRHKAMVGGALARDSALRVGLGVGGATIVSGSCAHPSHSRISRLLTSSLSLGISSLFCRVTQCV
jgi:hypothetical protein